MARNKIRKNSTKVLLSKVVIWAFFLADTRFFYMIKLPGILSGGAANKMLLGLVSAFIFFVFLIIPGKKRVNKYYMSLIMGFFAIFLFSSISSLYLFNYKITEVLYALFPFLTLLLYCPFSEIFKNRDMFEYFVKIGKLVWSIMSVLFIVQYFYRQRTGIDFLKLDGMLAPRYIITPSLGMRIYAVFDGFARVFIIFLAHKIITSYFKNCVSDIFCLLLLMAAIVIVDQSRFYLISIVITFLLEFLYVYRNKISVKVLVIGIIGLFGGGIAVIAKVWSILSTIESRQDYVYARFGGYKYFFNLFVEHCFFGVGPETPADSSPNYMMLHGPHGLFHIDDIGFVGALAKFGLPICVWIIFFMIYYYKVNRQCSKQNRLFGYMLLFIFVINLPLASYFDPQRSVSLLIMILFSDACLFYSNICKVGDICKHESFQIEEFD